VPQGKRANAGRGGVVAECDEGVAAPAFCLGKGTLRFGGRVFLVAFFAGILGALLRHVFRARLGVGWPDFPLLKV
jgi:hypothetical protein